MFKPSEYNAGHALLLVSAVREFLTAYYSYEQGLRQALLLLK